MKQVTGRRSRLSPSRNFFLVAALLFTTLALWNHIVVTVPPGHIGVLWFRFFGGPLKGFYFGEGTKLIFPWDKVFVYDARLRRLDREVEGLTNDGLKVNITFTLTYFIAKGVAADLQQSFGPNYEMSLIEPVVVSQLALFVADNGVEQMYSLTRSAIEAAVINGIQQKITAVSEMRGATRAAVHLVDVDILRVTLPPAFRDAVELKMSAQQDIQRRQYLIEQQRLTNEQKISEARGIQTVQSIVTPGMTDAYLRWESIRVGAQLALSPNARTVVIGAGSPGVPLLFGLGQQDSAGTPAAGAPRPASPINDTTGEDLSRKPSTPASGN